MVERPLAGVRVLDFTWVRAGPWATRWLAVLGAEVIKVEWPDPALGTFTGRLPVTRAGATPEGVPAGLNSNGHFSDQNAHKLSVTINTRSERGLELVRRLVADSDVVIENFSTGVLERWGLGYEQMRTLRSDIVYVSMAGLGHTGPDATFTTMGPSVQALSGLTFLSGLPEHPPAGWGWSYMDDSGGMYGAMSVLTALLHRDRTGEGQHVDLSQVAAGMTLTGAALLDLTANGRPSHRPGYPPGNRSVWPGAPLLDNYRGPIAAPHNAYRTRGGGYNDWCVIVCQSDEEWRTLEAVMGSPAWAADRRFATLEERLEHQEELDRHIEQWTATLDKYELTARCQAAGVRAMPVQSSEDRVEHDPQLRHREAYRSADHPVIGRFPLQQAPWRFSDAPTPAERAGPLAGEHNVAVLVDRLGLAPEELRAGYEDGTFWPGNVPLEPYLLEDLAQHPDARPGGAAGAGAAP